MSNATTVGFVVLLALAGNALAADPEGTVLERERPPAGPTHPRRFFAFAIDPSSPGAGATSVEYRVGFASGLAADRPLPADISSAGGRHSLAVGHGLTDWFAPYASATLFDEGSKANVFVGARFQMTRPAAPLEVTLLAAGLREAEGDYGVQLTAASSYRVGRLRVAANAQAERIFDPGRDSIDLLVMAGTSFAVTTFLRVGAEYVGQDLEDAFEEAEAEGGARHIVGPNVALDLEGGRYQLVLGGGFGLTRATPDAILRAQLAFSF